MKRIFIKLFKLGVILTASLILLILALAVVNNINRSQSSPTVTFENNSNIECFVNGISVQTTRENCATLSKQQTQQAQRSVIIQQPATIPYPTMPPMQKMQKTNCHRNFDGSVQCYTSEF